MNTSCSFESCRQGLLALLGCPAMENASSSGLARPATGRGRGRAEEADSNFNECIIRWVPMGMGPVFATHPPG